MNLLAIKALITVVVLSVLSAGMFVWGYNSGLDKRQAEWDAEKVAASEARDRAREKNEATITHLTETKNENLAIIDAMRTDLMRLRVHLPKAACPGSLPDPAPAAGGVLQATGTGYVSTPAQAAFDGFTVEMGADATRADEVVEHCRVVMNWAKGIK